STLAKSHDSVNTELIEIQPSETSETESLETEPIETKSSKSSDLVGSKTSETESLETGSSGSKTSKLKSSKSSESLETGSSGSKTSKLKSSKSSEPTETGVPSCPRTTSISSGPVKKYIMKLSSKKVAHKHYTILEKCFNKVVETNNSLSKRDNKAQPKNKVIPFTIGNYTGYLAFFPSDVAAELNKLDAIDEVIEDIQVSLADNCYYESQDVSSGLGLPVYGYYNYPGSGGEDVTIYVVDT
ncbi:13671_t:CDS:2, partial [Racocetra persica]